jgi:hypothetical protein
MGYLFKSLTGRSYKNRPAGVVDIPFLGAKVGEIDNWSLRRRGDEGADASLYDLHAAFSFLSKPLWEDDEYDKRIVVSLNPQQQYRLEQVPGQRTVLQGKSLLVEGVKLCPLEA